MEAKEGKGLRKVKPRCVNHQSTFIAGQTNLRHENKNLTDILSACTDGELERPFTTICSVADPYVYIVQDMLGCRVLRSSHL